MRKSVMRGVMGTFLACAMLATGCTAGNGNDSTRTDETVSSVDQAGDATKEEASGVGSDVSGEQLSEGESNQETSTQENVTAEESTLSAEERENQRKEEAYEQAVGLFEEGQYAEAEKLFAKLPDFGESNRYLRECQEHAKQEKLQILYGYYLGVLDEKCTELLLAEKIQNQPDVNGEINRRYNITFYDVTGDDTPEMILEYFECSKNYANEPVAIQEFLNERTMMQGGDGGYLVMEVYSVIDGKTECIYSGQGAYIGEMHAGGVPTQTQMHLMEDHSFRLIQRDSDSMGLSERYIAYQYDAASKKMVETENNVFSITSEYDMQTLSLSDIYEINHNPVTQEEYDEQYTKYSEEYQGIYTVGNWAVTEGVIARDFSCSATSDLCGNDTNLDNKPRLAKFQERGAGIYQAVMDSIICGDELTPDYEKATVSIFPNQSDGYNSLLISIPIKENKPTRYFQATSIDRVYAVSKWFMRYIDKKESGSCQDQVTTIYEGFCLNHNLLFEHEHKFEKYSAITYYVVNDWDMNEIMYDSTVYSYMEGEEDERQITGSIDGYLDESYEAEVIPYLDFFK